MFKKTAEIIILFIVLLGLAFVLSKAPRPKVSANKADKRILILVPHPDDEAISCAGVIQQALQRHDQVKIVYLTNGDHNQFAFIVYEKRIPLRQGEFIHMGEVRMDEARKAMRSLGLDENNLIFLGYPDFGTFAILRNYWESSRPYRSILTRISKVPYKTDFSFGSAYTGNNIIWDLKRVILNYRPDIIYVSHPADVNVDHKSLYIFLQVALADLRNLIKEPEVRPYLVHHVGWPLPRHYHPELSLEPPLKLSDGQINWSKVELDDKQLENKHRCILDYRSQTSSSAFYLLSFARKNELFGDYPPIDLTKGSQPAGPVNYSVENDELVIKIDKTKDVLKHVSTLIYIFGYNYDKPFAKMPKIVIASKYDRTAVFSGFKKLKYPDTKAEFFEEALVLRIPLKLLGDPDFVLTSVKVYGRESLSYFAGFRKIILKKEGGR